MITNFLTSGTEVQFTTEREFLSYLARGMKWKAGARQRKLKPGLLDAGEFDQMAKAQPGVATHVSGLEFCDRTVRMIQGLSKKHRQLILARIQHRTQSEAAASLGMAPSTFRKALSRVTGRLQRNLD